MPRFLLSLICIVLLTGAASKAEQPLSWEAVQGVVLDGYKMYIDRNSLSRVQTDNSDTATGAFLLVPDSNGMQFKNKEGKIVTAISLVRLFGVDCVNGLAMPILDMYFDTKTPVRESKSIGTLAYKNATPINIHPQSSVLFKTLCTNYPV